MIENGRVYARGASDDKGNMLIPILAVEAMLKGQGALPINLKFFFEGQEEIGSPQIPDFVKANSELFACDFVVSADGGQYGEDQPSLTVGSKGLCALQIDVQGAKKRWARPTLELNGIWGGFQGEGVKTVLPNEAHAKITCRLVADQDPVRIVELIQQHCEKHAPKGVRVTARRLPGMAKPYLMPNDHPGNAAAHTVLEGLYGKAPYYARTGGTIPVCELFLSTLGAYTVGFAFGLGDENVHAPDEFFRLSSWERGQVAYCKLLEQLAR